MSFDIIFITTNL